MSETYLVYTCAHIHPKVDNRRFSLLGELIYDLRPDKVVSLGDENDMFSLSSFDDKAQGLVQYKSYEKDIIHHGDAQERKWHRVKKNKVKKPWSIGLEGNHEHRIKRAVEQDPKLEGDKFGISFKHLENNRWFDEYYEYKNGAPAIASIGGIDFAHYIATGNYGTALSGKHHAYSLLEKRMNSCVVGHSHKRDVYFRDDTGKCGIVAGCFKGGPEHWAGQANNEWWFGAVVLHNVGSGSFEPQFISLDMLEKEYGSKV